MFIYTFKIGQHVAKSLLPYDFSSVNQILDHFNGVLEKCGQDPIGDTPEHKFAFGDACICEHLYIEHNDDGCQECVCEMFEPAEASLEE